MNGPRLYSLIARDNFDKEWQVVMAEDARTSFEQQSTLTTIDSRTSHFEDQIAFEKYLFETGYRVVSDEVDSIKLGTSGKLISIDKLLVTEKNKEAFSGFLDSKKCRLVKITDQDILGFPYIYIINRSNGTVSRSPVLYKNQTKLIPMCNKYSESNKVDINEPIVRDTINDFFQYVVNGKATRFLLGEENSPSLKYIDRYLYSLVLDYYQDPNLYHTKILQCFESYKVFRNVYLGIQAYKMKLQSRAQDYREEFTKRGVETTSTSQTASVEKAIKESETETIEDLIKKIKGIAEKPVEKIEWEQTSLFDNNGPSKIIKPNPVKDDEANS